VDWWKVVFYVLLCGVGAVFVFLVLVVLRLRWGLYLLMSRDYGVELCLAAVGGLALAWLVANVIKGEK
jgi:hypothetical protein